MNKPIVKYIGLAGYDIEVGHSAIVVPTDHMSALVHNGAPARTSTVLSYDADTGTFETRNTIYVLDTE